MTILHKLTKEQSFDKRVQDMTDTVLTAAFWLIQYGKQKVNIFVCKKHIPNL